MAITAGTKVGPYEIVSPLGAGGMGEVWRARDTRLGRDVAIKVLHESVAADPERRARFEREARAIAAISHPHILAVFDIGQHEGHLFVVTELLEGATLRERLAEGPLPFRKVVDLGVQVARGLTAAHERGIVHRDLKPENLFCTSDGLTKILDFGLALQLTMGAGSGATETVAATDPGTVLGTVGYMAPEQVRGQTVDPRTDLFSLGAVLFEAASGTRAFQRDTAADTITAILREDPPDISTSRVDFSPAFDRIVRHCLEKAPEERFQTARDVAFALSSLSGSTPSLSTTVDAAAPAASSRGRFSGLPTAAGLALVAALAGAGVGRWTAPAEPLWTFARKTVVNQTIFNSRFMPDGDTVIISAAMRGSTPSLFESRAGRATPRPFGPPGTHLLSVSATGELLVLTQTRFMGHRQMRGTLSRMTVDGTPRAIAEDVREADWLPDGSDFVVVRDRDATDVLEFPLGHAVYSATGYISSPRVSPDGTRVAFLEHPVKWDNRGWVKVVDRAGTVTTVGGEYPGQEGVAWSPDGREVYFGATGEGDGYRLWASRADGSTAPRHWLRTAGSGWMHDVSADGRVLFTLEDNIYGVFVRTAADNTETDLTPSRSAWGPRFSADGRHVLMTDGSDLDPDYAVVIRPVDGAPATRLGTGDAWGLSPDGQWALAYRFSTRQCVVYPTGAGTAIVLDTSPLEDCGNPGFSEDGKFILVSGNEPGQPRGRYRLEFPKGPMTKIDLPQGLSSIAARSATGRMMGPDGDGRLVIVAAGFAVTPARGVRAGDRVLHWGQDDRWLFVVSPGPALEVSKIDLQTGTRTVIQMAPTAVPAGRLTTALQSYHPDTGLFLYSYISRTSVLYVAQP